MIAAVVALTAALSPSATGRRLLAACADVPVREAHGSGLPLAVDVRGGATPEIVIDLERLPHLPPGEADAEYARALARASIAAPVPLVEEEQAERQWAAQVILELAADDEGLSKALHGAELKPAAAAVVLDRSAVFLDQFERDPYEAYWAVESGAGLPREAARLTALEDMFSLRAADIRALKEAPSGAYVPLGGRRYPGTLARAAYRLREPGSLEKLREALGAFDTVGVVPFSDAIKRWRRALLSR